MQSSKTLEIVHSLCHILSQMPFFFILLFFNHSMFWIFQEIYRQEFSIYNCCLWFFYEFVHYFFKNELFLEGIEILWIKMLWEKFHAPLANKKNPIFSLFQLFCWFLRFRKPSKFSPSWFHMVCVTRRTNFHKIRT